jgi:hypothetical protein
MSDMFELIVESSLILLAVVGLCLLSYMIYGWFSVVATGFNIDPVRFERLCQQHLNKMQRRVRILQWATTRLNK